MAKTKMVENVIVITIKKLFTSRDLGIKGKVNPQIIDTKSVLANRMSKK